jgi:NADPH2:quinone reductase
MSKAIRIHETGGPEILRWEDVDVNPPGFGEARVRHTAIGVNYIDVYGRTGLHHMPSFPHTLGMEAAGIVEAIGKGVSDVAVGDRIAYVIAPPGAYSEERVVPADRLIKLPEGVSDETGAAMLLKGMTAQYLLHQTYVVKAGDNILIHAAAGGVGLIVCQWAKHLGAKVIGTVGSDEKAALAKSHGCDHTIVYTRESFKDRVSEITDGEGVDVVYDSIGKVTFMDSLDSLKPLGMMVTFGNASGPVDAFSPGILAAKGSLFVTRPTIFTYIAKRNDLLAMAADLFEVVASGVVKIEINQTYDLSNAAQAHIDLEARKTTGSTILKP